MKDFDLIVIGAGHAGCEAALAAARMGLTVGLMTLSRETIARMSCNPAIGGLAKGHMVREIDALGGEMGRVIDRTGIQFRMLNRKKGPAVRGPRAQADKAAYSREMRRVIESEANITLVESLAEGFEVRRGQIEGVHGGDGAFYSANCVVVTTGTFLRGLMHTGREKTQGGRVGEKSAENLSGYFRKLGLELGRLKTGTPPRLHRRSIDFDVMQIQPGDNDPHGEQQQYPVGSPQVREEHGVGMHEEKGIQRILGQVQQELTQACKGTEIHPVRRRQFPDSSEQSQPHEKVQARYGGKHSYRYRASHEWY